jgi:hypothetical protein
MIFTQIAAILLALTVPLLLLILVGQQERILNTLEDLAYGDDEDDGGYGGGSSYGLDPDSPPDSPDDLAREIFERIQEIRSARN